MTILYIVLGTIFGFTLSRSGAADYDYVQGMFLFERFQLYGILATGVIFAAPALWLIKRRGRTLAGLVPPGRADRVGGGPVRGGRPLVPLGVGPGSCTLDP